MDYRIKVRMKPRLRYKFIITIMWAIKGNAYIIVHNALGQSDQT